MRRLLPTFCAICAWAQSGIEIPTIGMFVDPSGALRPVQGVAGNFWLGPSTVSGVLSAACSERMCLAKTDSKIVSAMGETDAPSGRAIFAFDAGEAIAYFPDSRTFARWHDNVIEPLDWAVDGEVLAIRIRDGAPEIAVRRDGRVWIVRPDGAVVDWIADTTGPVLLLADSVLFVTGEAIFLRGQDASEVRLVLAGAQSITAMGPHYATIRAGDATYALRTEPGQEQLFMLPGSAP